MTIHFTVIGVPQQTGSKKPFTPKRKDGSYVKRPGGTLMTNIVDTNEKKAKPWMKSVRDAAAEAYQGPILQGPIHLTVLFCMPRPKHHYGTGRNAGKLKPSAPKYHTVAPDLTKLIRCLEDSLKGVIWRDDSQVAIQGPHYKRYASEQACAGVCIEEVPDA